MECSSSTFSLGKVVATPGALATLEEARESALSYLERHASRDWGEIPPEDWEENEFSLTNELRILSADTLRNGGKIWIITEADRSITVLVQRKDEANFAEEGFRPAGGDFQGMRIYRSDMFLLLLGGDERHAARD